MRFELLFLIAFCGLVIGQVIYHTQEIYLIPYIYIPGICGNQAFAEMPGVSTIA